MKLICFYLPQFHPIPENDAWWGRGFTEWTNVVKARPLFKGHYQPHIPADLGFYDLRLEETRIAQAELAKENGIYGFCYYHYWFNSKRLLERPFNEVLYSGKPDFPFCLCWANENWTRRWDGEDREILVKQNYNHEDDRNHIRSLFKSFEDKRYIRINGKPLFLIYRVEWLPNPLRTAEIWREEAIKAGVGDLYLIVVESLNSANYIDPNLIGFDAALEFAPDWQRRGKIINRNGAYGFIRKLGIFEDVYHKNYISLYDDMINDMLSKDIPKYKWYRSVTPSWDNTPRRQSGANIFVGSEPGKYQRWLEKIIEYTDNHFDRSEAMVFINAWNEWAEGCHLEPDLRYGRQYLQATKNALIKSGGGL